MRTPTKVASSLLAAGVLAISYKLGTVPASGTGLITATSSGSTENTLDGTSGSATPTASATPTPTPSASASASATPTPKATKSKTPTPKKTTTTTTTDSGNTGGTTGGTTGGNTGGNTGGTTTPTTTTKTGAVVYETRWNGAIQLSVTKDSSGKITAITPVVFVASGPAWGSSGTLIQAALSAQGSNFGNLSRATYTTNAFKQALDSALAKF